MKYLSDYTEERQTKLFNKYGAFFAFGNKQFKEARKEGVKYARLTCGLICPEQHAKKIADGLCNIQRAAIKQDIADNGIKGIIHRELGNYECQITGDTADTQAALSNYPGITEELILKEYKLFYRECVKNDWF